MQFRLARPFLNATVRGAAGQILWGYRPAAWLRSWTISKEHGQWRLRGTADRIDAFQLRQKPLIFTAPRGKGQWCWPVTSVVVNQQQIIGTLGPPEQ